MKAENGSTRKEIDSVVAEGTEDGIFSQIETPEIRVRGKRIEYDRKTGKADVFAFKARPTDLFFSKPETDGTTTRIDAHAHRQTWNLTTGILTLDGDVRATTDTFRLDASLLRVHTTPDTAARKIEKAVAEGDVRITYDEAVATGNRATYHPTENRMEIEGMPAVVTRGVNRISGTRLSMDNRTGALIVESGERKQVEAFITPNTIPQPEKKTE